MRKIEHLSYLLSQFFWRHVSDGHPLAMITVLSTEGSTYSKTGSQMLVNTAGELQGMLSGGCLEGDLAERSKGIIESGIAEIITYDLRGDDEVFGLGIGCEGVIKILIQPLSLDNDYQPFHALLKALESASEAEMPLADASKKIGVSCIKAPVRLLILGAGLDAEPLVVFAVTLGWEVNVSDYRPALVDRLKKNNDVMAECIPHHDIALGFDLSRFDAAIVMSHNLDADRSYLSALADSSIDYIGLLGPPHRRDRLMRDLEVAASSLRDRLHSPVGKRIGGRGPAAIALEIVAELQAYFYIDTT